MRLVHLADLGQTGVRIPPRPPLYVPSFVGVNVYQGGYSSGQGYWGGDVLPLEGAEITVTVTGTTLTPSDEANLVGDEPVVVTAKTPKSGYAEIQIPAPPGTWVDIAVTYQGQTQHRKIITAASSGDALAEFHFDVSAESKIPALAIAIPAIIVVGLVGYWLYHGR